MPTRWREPLFIHTHSKGRQACYTVANRPASRLINKRGPRCRLVSVVSVAAVGGHQTGGCWKGVEAQTAKRGYSTPKARTSRSHGPLRGTTVATPYLPAKPYDSAPLSSQTWPWSPSCLPLEPPLFSPYTLRGSLLQSRVHHRLSARIPCAGSAKESMPSNEEAQQSQARRPPVARHPSTSSQISQSPSEPSTSHRQGAYKPQRHVVGHGRLAGSRNTSVKNLSKLTKLHPANDGSTGTPTARHHTRTKSGDSPVNASSSSPRPTVKRNASAFAVTRTASHSALKKTYSSGHLPRHGSSKNIMKSAKHQAPPMTKRTRSHRSDHSEQSEPEPPHPTVRFALGDEVGPGDEQEDEAHEGDEWTEESASASPHTTRSSTPARQSSITAEGSMEARAEEAASQYSRPQDSPRISARTPPSSRTRMMSDRSPTMREINGSGSYLPSRAPDADVITSRLLQRAPSHNPNPQVSTISATVTAEGHDVRPAASLSQGSTLGDGTPGRDLVSRFINTSGSGGTPKDVHFLPRAGHTGREGGESELHKRNKSAPNLADRAADSPASVHSRPHSHRSGTSPPTELPPSRTQQKLLLQRASSNIEPQKHVPAVLPRSGASQLIGHGVSFSTEGAFPPQIQGIFNQTTREYQVVRRFKSPIADAITRLSEIPSAPRQKQIPKPKGKTTQANGVDGRYGLSQSYRSREEQHIRDARIEQHGHAPNGADHASSSDRRSTHGHRSRVSFDLPGRPQDEEEEEQDSFPGSDNGRVRDEAYEICRRLWEIGEVAEAG
jgi:hypothetical protein